MGRQLGLEDDSERTIADDFALRVLHFPDFAGATVLDFLPDDLYAGRQQRPRPAIPWPEPLTSHAQAREAGRAILRRHVGARQNVGSDGVVTESMAGSSSRVAAETRAETWWSPSWAMLAGLGTTMQNGGRRVRCGCGASSATKSADEWEDEW